MTNNMLNFWKSFQDDGPLEPLFEAAPVMMHSIDHDGTLTRVSRFWAEKLGYAVDELIGRKASDFLSPASQDRALLHARPPAKPDGNMYNVEYEFICKDGTHLPVLLSAVSEYSESGDHLRSLAVIFDNTEAKRVSAELQRKQRSEAIGSLIGGVAHDFNNLLAVIQGNLEFLERDPNDPDREEFIDSALSAARHGATLTQQLLSYGRKANLTPEPVDMNRVVGDVERLIRRLFPANIELETVNLLRVWDVEIDVSQLETALLNILNNARDAMPNGGKISIEARNVEINEDYVTDGQEVMMPGRYVQVVISDTGIGMDTETRERIFDPYYTTKPLGKGSGLGLSMVFGFMRQSRGFIRCHSAPNDGASFRLYFPATDRVKTQTVEVETARPVDRPSSLVLLVEDDTALRCLLVRQLRQNGIRVTHSATGDDALRQIKNGMNPDILLTDVVLAGRLQGPELANHAREILPDLNVVFLSGYTLDSLEPDRLQQPSDRYLLKPVSEHELVTVLHAIIDYGGTSPAS